MVSMAGHFPNDGNIAAAAAAALHVGEDLATKPSLSESRPPVARFGQFQGPYTGQETFVRPVIYWCNRAISYRLLALRRQ